MSGQPQILKNVLCALDDFRSLEKLADSFVIDWLLVLIQPTVVTKSKLASKLTECRKRRTKYKKNKGDEEVLQAFLLEPLFPPITVLNENISQPLETRVNRIAIV